MSNKAQTLVEERSRAKGSNLGVLRAIADYAKDNGRHAFPSIPTLAWKNRLTKRAAELIVRKLVEDGEVDPQWDAHEHRLYLNVRCISDWTAYQAEGPIPERENISRSTSEKFARSLMKTATQRAKKLSSDDPKSASDDSSCEQKPVENPATDTAGEGSPSQPFSEPCIEPCTEPVREAAAPPTPDRLRPTETDLDAFRLAFNGCTQEPIPRCSMLTTQRRRLIRAALAERPFPGWLEIFRQIERSSHCHGQNSDGWVLTLDWLVRSSDNALRVVEGQFDNRLTPQQRRALGPVPVGDEEQRRLRAERHRLPAHMARVLYALRHPAPATAPLGAVLGVTEQELATIDVATDDRDEQQRIARQLAQLDHQLIAIARAALDADDTARVTRDAEREMAPYRLGMAAPTFNAAREAAIVRLVREHYKLPVLTWDGAAGSEQVA